MGEEPPPSVLSPSWSPSSSSSASLRWARIPFDVLDDWQSEAKKKKKNQHHSASQTHICDIPEPVIAVIFSLISDTRSRNSMALVCTDWYSLERATRFSLCLRGNTSDLYLIPRSFQAVEHLDLSQCSPWGYSLFQSIPERALLVGHLLKQAFPRVQRMVVYARDARDIEMVACFWPDLQSLKLIRWHQRPTLPEEASGLGMEFLYLMRSCKILGDLDLSQFYCWTEDIPPALQVEPAVSSNLHTLNLLKVSGDGFKASEVEAITNACRNLEELRLVVVFDHRYLDFVGDAALLQIAKTCKKLRVLQIIDSAAFDDIRGEPEEGFAAEDAQITVQGLIAAFQALPLLEDLKFILSLNVGDAAPALEALSSHCKRLTSLSLGHFHGLCRGPQLGGITLCRGLKELTIKNCADLNDVGMMAIADGCTGLQKLCLQTCKEVSKAGLYALAYKLQRTLKEVEVSCCLLMNAVNTLWALQPIQGTIEHLHVDCLLDADFAARDIGGTQELHGMSFRTTPHAMARRVIDGFSADGNVCTFSSLNSGSIEGDTGQVGSSAPSLDLNSFLLHTDTGNGLDELSLLRPNDGRLELNIENTGIEDTPRNTRLGVAFDPDFSGLNGTDSRPLGASKGVDKLTAEAANPPEVPPNHSPDTNDEAGIYVVPDFSLDFCSREWTKLKFLSLWIYVGELLSPLPRLGLQLCPSLQEARIKVEGDSRLCPRPKTRVSGISSLATYPMLSKLTFDCSELVGYALSAPLGHMELSLWERWYLQGIQSLKLLELDYWPPQDRDANRRKLSLPGAGLISQCVMLRKLILHGTINEHLLKMFLKMPNLRDVQLRIDYYPAPDVDLNTEMRADACKRFEVALAERGFPE